VPIIGNFFIYNAGHLVQLPGMSVTMFTTDIAPVGLIRGMLAAELCIAAAAAQMGPVAMGQCGLHPCHGILYALLEGNTVA